MMKVKLIVTRDNKEEILYTSLFVIAEWERKENRRASDGRGIGASEFGCWAHTILTLKGETLPASWLEWLKQNPDMTIAGEDVTNPNPTDAATGDNSPNL
jgi:hypothetical protein